ncbi:MAG: hypothetical protein ACFFHD_02650 [Promethearchaeota archaeon]
MVLITLKDRVKQERKSIYFDLICGTFSSTIALIGIIFVGLTKKITHLIIYYIGLTFWICYLIFSIFMICLGIFLWYKEKHFDEQKPKKDLKPPII